MTAAHSAFPTGAPRAQPLPAAPVCVCGAPMAVTTKLNAQCRPRLSYDATCPECGAARKDFTA